MLVCAGLLEASIRAGRWPLLRDLYILGLSKSSNLPALAHAVTSVRQAVRERGRALKVYLGDAEGRRELQRVVRSVREQGLRDGGLDPDDVIVLSGEHARWV